MPNTSILLARSFTLHFTALPCLCRAPSESREKLNPASGLVVCLVLHMAPSILLCEPIQVRQFWPRQRAILEAMKTGSPPGQQLALTSRCSCCKCDVPSDQIKKNTTEDAVTGAKEQLICKGCMDVKGRMKTVTRGILLFKVVAEIKTLCEDPWGLGPPRLGVLKTI